MEGGHRGWPMEAGWGTVLNLPGLHPTADTHQQGLKASTRGFLVETIISKLKPHPLGLSSPNPMCMPWVKVGTSTCAPPMRREGQVMWGEIRPELGAEAWPFVSAVSLLVTDGDAVLVNLLPSRWHAICLHPDSERRDSSCPSSNWQQGAVFTFDRAKKH